MFLSKATQEAMWLLKLNNNLKLTSSLQGKIAIYTDSQAAIASAKNNQASVRTKHVQIRDLFVKEKVQDGSIDLLYISTDSMIADIFTKPMNKLKFMHLRQLLGVVPISHN